MIPHCRTNMRLIFYSSSSMARIFMGVLLFTGTITVGGMRMNPCRQGHPTSTIGALPSLSSSFFADRDIGHGGERNRDPLSCRFARLRSPCRKTPPQVARESAGTLCMRSRGRRRIGRSELYSTIPMIREQREASRRGQERAALARKQQEQQQQHHQQRRRQEATLSASVMTTGGASTTRSDSVVVDDPRDILLHPRTPGQPVAAQSDSQSQSHPQPRPPRDSDTNVVAVELNDVSRGVFVQRGGGQEVLAKTEAARGSPEEDSKRIDGKATRRRRERRNRKRRKQGKPLSRPEAVKLLCEAVTRYRAAQVSSSSCPADCDTTGVAEGGEATGATEKDAGTLAAEEFAELARRCLGSGLPEIALEAHSLYVRASTSGLGPAKVVLVPTAPETAAFATVPDNWAGSNIRRERREAEKKLLLCAARAHVSMGGVLDGLALIDDAARLGGDMARKGGRWGGDGDAGAGAARLLSNEEASELVEELCVNGREIGLRAALRLRERLAEQNRHLTREARLCLLEGLAAKAGRDLGVVFESTGTSLTFPGVPPFSPLDRAWFATLRANARDAWGGGVLDGDLDLPPLLPSADGPDSGGGGGWVPRGARAVGTDRAEVDGEGALVPGFDSKTAVRMAEELFAEMVSTGKEGGGSGASSRAQASLVRVNFRGALVGARGPAPPAAVSDLADRTPSAFEESDLELALSVSQTVADRFNVKNAKKSAKKNSKKSKSAVEDGKSKVSSFEGTLNAGGKKGGSSGSSDGQTRAENGSPSRTPREKQKSGRAKEEGTTAMSGEGGGFGAVSALLQECLACNYTAGAEMVLERMVRERYWALTSTYNTLLWYFRRDRDAKAALDTLQSLRESETVAPDKLSYTLAIQACVWSGSCMDEAWTIIEEAEQAGVSFSSKDLLDARLVLVHAVGGDVMEGMREMAARGISPDESTLLGVIEACSERGDVKGALDVLQMMRAAARERTATSSLTGGPANAAGAVCPRPSYRSYLAALTACSRATLPAATVSGKNGAVPPGPGPEVDEVRKGAAQGDWGASKEILEMMWEDEAMRVAEGNAAIPGTWSPVLQEALRLGPSHMTMPAVPDASCYQLAMECCVAGGRNDEALSLLAEMESKGLSPNEAGLRALIRGFAAEGGIHVQEEEGVTAAEVAERKWRSVEKALGVFEELAEKFDPPSRASFESAIDACVSHPDGLQCAANLIDRMKAIGHDLGSEHYNVLIRGFGDARNLGAALNVFQEMREGVAIGGPGGGRQDRTLGWEVEEDMFAALLGACTRSGEAENVSEAIGFLRMNGVNPPSEILSYLQNDEFESELYDQIFGERDRREGKAKEKSRARKYGTHMLAAQLLGHSVKAASGRGNKDDDGDLKSADTDDDGTPRRGLSSRAAVLKGFGDGAEKKRQRRGQTFAEAARDCMKRLEEARIKWEAADKGENDGGSTSPRHPVGWVGIFTEVFTHAERKEEALKRRAGEARSRERRAKRRESERLARAASASTSDGVAVNIARGDITGGEKVSDQSKDGAKAAAMPGGQRQRDSALLERRRRAGGKGTSLARPGRPLRVRLGGSGAGQGSMTEEDSPDLEAVVAGLRRKGRVRRWRGRQGGSAAGEASASNKKKKRDEVGAE